MAQESPFSAWPERFDKQGERMHERNRRFAKLDAESTISLS